tara:strand:+ start:482 stop:1582 length:1101 start_codon:yes stop_codon:yes gene_type:complete
MSSKRNNSTLDDHFYMEQALGLAEKNYGLTGENPSVGCILVKNNQIISSGVTGINGRPHAEFNAIKDSFINVNGSTMYVTLEPCNHYGKTPPCTNLIRNKKIKKVVYGINDIDSRTSKSAKKFFEKKKIEVSEGVLNKKLNKFYRSYIYIKKNKLPYVIGKIASSKDNFIKSKIKKMLTNKFSQSISHLLRYRSHAILISYKTLNSDNPRLGCRLNSLEKYSPVRVILDKNLNLKMNTFVIKSAKKITTYVFYNKNNLKKINLLKKKGVKLKYLKLKNNNFIAIDIFKKLYSENIFYLLVEGGANLTQNFLTNNAFNEFFYFKSSKKIKKNGTIKLLNFEKKVKNKFKNYEEVKTYTGEDKILRYY